jgi:hypothetical protein
MKRIAGIIVGLFAGLLPAAAATPPTGPFLCILDQSTGFAFDAQSKSWRETNFRAGKKLILKRTDKSLHEVVPGVRMPVTGVWAVWAPCAGPQSTMHYRHS